MRAFEREQVLGAVVAGQRLLDCLDGGVAPRIPHARQHCGVALAAEDRLDLGRFYAHRPTPSEMVF